MEFELRRTVYTPIVKDSSEYEMLDVFLKQHTNVIVSEFVRKHYSKLSAIDELETQLQAGAISSEDAQKLLKAFLADRGELFAQTRERQFRFPHRWKDCAAKGRVMDIETKVRCYVDIRVKEHDGELEDDKLLSALRVLYTESAPCLYLKEDNTSEGSRENSYRDWCSFNNGELNRQVGLNGQMKDFYSTEEKLVLMGVWASQVMLAVQEKMEVVPAQEYLRNKFRLNDVEIYELLFHILPYCNELLEEQKRTSEQPCYQPVITAKQMENWEDQLKNRS